jgi:nucleoside-diphosphate-sugar epimerase
MEIKNILVTGASGKIGRNLIPALLKAGYSVRAVQFQTPLSIDGIDVTIGTISDPDFIDKSLEDMDAIIHLATSKEDPENFMNVSIKGTFQLLDKCKEKKQIKQFILAGGDAALGIFFYPQPIPLNENAPLRAYPGYYAFSKVMEETMCNQYFIQYRVPITILRASWIHDEDDILSYMTLRKPNFGGPMWDEIASTPEQKSYFLKEKDGVGCLRHPDGAAFKRHIVSIKDVIQAFLIAIGNPHAIGETFNIAAPSAFCYEVLAGYMSEKLDLPVVDFKLDGFYDFSIDINKARSVLAYNPEYDTFKIVDAAIEFRNLGMRRSEIKYFG